MMNKLILTSALLIFATSIPIVAYAQTDPFGAVNPPAFIDPTPNAVQNFVPTIITAFLIAGAIGVLIYLVYGGLKRITAGGDIKAISAANSTMVQAALGFILLSIALAIAWIADILTSGGIIVNDTSKTPVYICGFDTGLGPGQPGCTDPTQCKLCDKPRYYITKEKEAEIRGSASYGAAKMGTICVSSGECNSGCATNDSLKQYVYCRPPNYFK